MSPLLQGTDQKKRSEALKHVAPFWALLRAPTAHSAPTMMMGKLLVSVPSCTVGAGAPRNRWKFQTARNFTVELPHAVNAKPIEKGDVLMLPFAP